MMASMPATYHHAEADEKAQDFEDEVKSEGDHLLHNELPLVIVKRPTMTLVTSFAILVFFALCGLVFQSQYQLRTLQTELESLRHAASAPRTEAPSDEPSGSTANLGFFPNFGQENRMFGVVGDYEKDEPLSNKAWDALLKVGGPYLSIAEPQQYGLPSSRRVIDDPARSELYAVSALHQLHCLAILRDLYIAHENGVTSRFDGTRHPLHCFDYIREGILCAGDTTLEPGLIYFDHQMNHSVFLWEGAGTMHQCRDWNHIASFLTERRLPGKEDLRMM